MILLNFIFVLYSLCVSCVLNVYMYMSVCVHAYAVGLMDGAVTDDIYKRDTLPYKEENNFRIGDKYA